MIRLIRENGTALVAKIERRRWVVDAREELPSLHVSCENRRGQRKEKRDERDMRNRKAGIRNYGNYARNSVNLIRACLGSWPR